jgi:hypothetical protein
VGAGCLGLVAGLIQVSPSSRDTGKASADEQAKLDSIMRHGVPQLRNKDSRYQLTERQSRTFECAHCHRQVRRIMQNVTRLDGSTFGVCFASLHDEPAVKDAWIDVILGTFGDGAPEDHVTFGCRIVPGSASRPPVISAVDAAAAFGYRPIMGLRLTREQALQHPRVDDFWTIVDLVLLADPEVHAHVYKTA